MRGPPLHTGAIVINTQTVTTVVDPGIAATGSFGDPPVGRPTARYVPVTGHEEALARLLYLAEHGRPGAVMVGAEGVGKSLLLSEAAKELRNGRRCVITLDMKRLEAEDVVERTLLAARLTTSAKESRLRRERRLRDFFQGHQLVGHPVVFLVDHLEGATASGLNALDHLLSLADQNLGTITVLAASVSIDEAFRCEWLAKHSELRIELPRLSTADTAEYIASTLLLSGSGLSFSDGAINRIAEHSSGTPREINRVARLAAIAAESEGYERIDEELVDVVIAELPAATRPHATLTGTR